MNKFENKIVRMVMEDKLLQISHTILVCLRTMISMVKENLIKHQESLIFLLINEFCKVCAVI